MKRLLMIPLVMAAFTLGGCETMQQNGVGKQEVGAVSGAVLQTSSTTDELYISWDYVNGAEEYELEWTWIDNYPENTHISTSPLAAIALNLTDEAFKTNCTRIRTGDQFYRIPHVFAKGYVVYRVRAVGRWYRRRPDRNRPSPLAVGRLPWYSHPAGAR